MVVNQGIKILQLKTQVMLTLHQTYSLQVTHLFDMPTGRFRHDHNYTEKVSQGDFFNTVRNILILIKFVFTTSDSLNLLVLYFDLDSR